MNVEQDYATAQSWFLEAAELGDARSMYFLGYMYSKGLGVEADQEKSAQWYLKSAEAGYITSMYTIGRRYELGNGVEQNTETAIGDDAFYNCNSLTEIFVGRDSCAKQYCINHNLPYTYMDANDCPNG